MVKDLLQTRVLLNSVDKLITLYLKARHLQASKSNI